MRNWILKILHFSFRPTRPFGHKKVADFIARSKRVLAFQRNKQEDPWQIYCMRIAWSRWQNDRELSIQTIQPNDWSNLTAFSKTY